MSLSLTDLDESLGQDAPSPRLISIGRDLDSVSSIAIPSAYVLFNAQYVKSGDDLFLISDNATIVVSGYFKSQRHPSLISPEGATINGDTVALMAGPDAPGQFAQAGPPAAAVRPIGRVEKVAGNATVARNGVALTLNMGDPVFKGDVVQTGQDSTLGISFLDGTAFNLSSTARMALNDMVYDPNGTSNSALISLVQGSISFVAGKIAKTGDMKVETPVATMGIRGTAVLVEISANNGPTKFSVMVEPNGTVGSFNLYDKHDPSVIIATVSSAGQATLITPQGPLEVLVQQIGKTPAELQAELGIVQQVFQIAALGQQNPLGLGPGGSSTPPGQGTGDGLNVQPPDINVPPLAHNNTTSTIAFPVAPTIGNTSDHPPLVSVANLVDTETAAVSGQFSIAARVTVTDPDHDPITAYVGGSAVLVAATGPASLPAGVVLANLITLDAATGMVGFPASFSFLAAGEAITFTINFNVQSGPDKVPTTLTVTINGINEAPVITAAQGAGAAGVPGAAGAPGTPANPIALTIAEAAATTGSQAVTVLKGSFAFTDPDFNDSHSVAVVPQGSGYVGTLTPVLTADGHGSGAVQWTFQVSDAALDFLAEGQSVNQLYDIVVSDGHGGSVAESVQVTLVGTNDAPFIPTTSPPPPTTVSLAEAPATTGSQTVRTLNGTFTFTDPDLIDTHSVKAVAEGTGYVGTLTPVLTADGNGGGIVHWTFEVTDAALDFLSEGQSVNQLYDIVVSDGHGGSLTETITVTLNGANDAPFIPPTSPPTPTSFSIAEAAGTTGSQTSTVLNGNFAFTDPDLNDTHSVAVVAQGTGYVGTLTPVLTADGHGGGSVQWTFQVKDAALDFLSAGQSVDQLYDIVVSDGHGGSVAETVTVTLNGANDPPLIPPSSPPTPTSFSVAEAPSMTGSQTVTVLNGNFTFTDPDLKDTHTVTVQPHPVDPVLGYSHYLGIFTPVLTSDGGGGGAVHWTFQVSDAALDFLAAGQSVNQLYDIVVSDGHGGSVAETVTVTLNGANDAPAITPATTNATGVITFSDPDHDHDIDTAASNTGVINFEPHTGGEYPTATGVITFTDPDLTDSHTASSVYTGSQPALGTLSLVETADTTNTGTGGALAWTYTIDDDRMPTFFTGAKVETFDVTIDDGHGGQAHQTVTITLTDGTTGQVAAQSAATPAATSTLAAAPAAPAQSPGHDPDQRIFGTPGHDNLTGGTGNDVITGFGGGDVLTGGLGNDTFVLAPGFGGAKITDFTATASEHDVIELHALSLATFASVLDHATQTGSGTVIDFGGGDVLTLAGVNLASLHQDDFRFLTA
jgi:VCBS repeat-containing protein